MTKKLNTSELELLQERIGKTGEELKVFIVDVLPQNVDKKTLDIRLEEVQNLVSTFGWLTVVKHIQKRSNPDYNTYIWKWKLEELMQEMQESWATILIFGDVLRPHQIYKVNENLRTIKAVAWDRVDLILKIFEKNAKSTESRLQIELAAIKHMWPRIFSMWMELWSQWSWWNKWSRWKWETNTKIMKDYFQTIEKNIKKDLDHYKKVRREHRKSRTRKWLNTIWIVGYTNAWKSSLMNILTKKWVLQEDKLFATLWTSVWKMVVLPDNYEDKVKEFLVNDTIWFIRDLPPTLIQAFASTLEDSIESDILFHVVDCSDEQMQEKIEVVDNILDEIHAIQDRIYVFNKIDLLDSEAIEEIKQKYGALNPIFISTYQKLWIDELKKEVVKRI